MPPIFESSFSIRAILQERKTDDYNIRLESEAARQYQRKEDQHFQEHQQVSRSDVGGRPQQQLQVQYLQRQRLQEQQQQRELYIQHCGQTAPSPSPSPSPSSPSPPIADTFHPGLTYAALIILAICSSKERRLLLSNIYDWIAEKFPHFSKQRPNWQNQVRHTLSTNSCFVKMPRAPDEPGRGNYWTVDTTAPGVVNGVLKQCLNLFHRPYFPPHGFAYHNWNTEYLANGVRYKHPIGTTAAYFPTPVEIQLQMHHEQYIRLLYQQQQQLKFQQQHSGFFEP